MADFNTDITKGSLFSGQGFIWGPKKQGPGNEPTQPGERNIDEFQSFDRTPQVNALIKSLYGDLGRQQRQAAGTAAKYGATKSSANIGRQATLAAGTEDRAANTQYQAALDAWKDKMAQKQFAEQMDLRRYEAALSKYKTDQALNAAEEERRSALWGPFGKYFQ